MPEDFLQAMGVVKHLQPQTRENGYAEKYAVNGKVYNVLFTANAYGIYYKQR